MGSGTCMQARHAFPRALLDKIIYRRMVYADKLGRKNGRKNEI